MNQQGESAWEKGRQAAAATLTTALGIGLLAGLIVFIYAPERDQQERLWQTTKSLMAPVGGALAMLGRFGGASR